MILPLWTRILRRTTRSIGVLPHLNLAVPGSIDGQPLKIPWIAGTILDVNLEPWMTDVLRALLPLLPGRFIDVGVNLGQTLAKLKVLEPGRPYMGFEPNPHCLGYVRHLIRANRFSGVDLIPVGLSTKDAIVNSISSPSRTSLTALRASYPTSGRTTSCTSAFMSQSSLGTRPLARCPMRRLPL
jgi:FkbM family methyltransferase